jgi:hypothetical protein
MVSTMSPNTTMTCPIRFERTTQRLSGAVQWIEAVCRIPRAKCHITKLCRPSPSRLMKLKTMRSPASLDSAPKLIML